MKIILTPNQGSSFTPAELLDQLGRWVLPGTRGQLTARATIGGKLKEVTLDIEQAGDDGPVPPEGPAR